MSDALQSAFPGLTVDQDEWGAVCTDVVTGCRWYLGSGSDAARPGLLVHALRLALLDDEASGRLTGSDVARYLGLP